MNRESVRQVPVPELVPPTEMALLLAQRDEALGALEDALRAREESSRARDEALAARDDQARAFAAVQEELRKEMERREVLCCQLAQQRAVLEHIIDNVPYSIFWKDRHSVYQGANRKKVRALGFESADQLIGKTDYEIGIDPKKADAQRESDRRVIKDGGAILNREETFRGKDGLQHVVLLSKVPLRDFAGAVTGVLGIAVDITDRKRMETELAQAKEEAEASAERQRRMFDELAIKHRDLEHALAAVRDTQEELVQVGKMAAVGTLAAGLSHELNNPLATILITAQALLRKMPADCPWRSAVGMIERHAKRSGRLVTLLLDFSRRRPVCQEAVSIVSVLDGVIELARSQVRGSNVVLEETVEPRSSLLVSGDAQQLEVALLNLVKNALDATQDGGLVRMQARLQSCTDKEGVEILVSDTGTGIPADILPQIFDPFFTTKAVGKGTGLGLSLARRIVEAHGGFIRAESVIGRGTTMRVWLPAANQRS
jgi:PAS domain S-box-containing protein